MRIIKSALKYGKPNQSEEDIVVPEGIFHSSHLRKLLNTHVKAISTLYDDFLRVELDVTALAICADSYTLKDVNLPLHIQEELLFSESEEDDDMFFEPNNIIELDEYIIGIIVANIPLKVVDKNSKLPDDGQGYRVLSEEDYLKEKENKIDERWSKLDELDLD